MVKVDKSPELKMVDSDTGLRLVADKVVDISQDTTPPPLPWAEDIKTCTQCHLIYARAQHGPLCRITFADSGIHFFLDNIDGEEGRRSIEWAARELGVTKERMRSLIEAGLPSGPEYNKCRIFACAEPRCSTMRSRDEGGTTFTVCDEHWDAHWKERMVSRG